MLKRTPNLPPPATPDQELLPLLQAVTPLRDTPDLMIGALDAMLCYHLEVTTNLNLQPYTPIPVHELRRV